MDTDLLLKFVDLLVVICQLCDEKGKTGIFNLTLYKKSKYSVVTIKKDTYCQFVCLYDNADESLLSFASASPSFDSCVEGKTSELKKHSRPPSGLGSA